MMHRPYVCGKAEFGVAVQTESFLNTSFQPTTTSSLPAPPLSSRMSAYYNPFEQDSPPDFQQRVGRWARADLTAGLPMPKDYARNTNVLPNDAKASQPIPMRQPRGRRNSLNAYQSPLVGGISNDYSSPLMERYREDEEEDLPRNSSNEQLPFPIDDLSSSSSASPQTSNSNLFFSSSSRPRKASSSSNRRFSVGHPMTSSNSGGFSSGTPLPALSPLNDLSSLSRNLPAPDSYSSYPSGTSSSGHSGLSSLFSRRGSTSSDASSVAGLGSYSGGGFDKNSPYARPVSRAFPSVHALAHFVPTDCTAFFSLWSISNGVACYGLQPIEAWFQLYASSFHASVSQEVTFSAFGV